MKLLPRALPPLLAVLLASCSTPDSVARFCSSAVVTLKTGDAIFDDLQASCVREAVTREPLGSFAVADPHPAVCAEIGRRAEELKLASKLLTDYFKALNDLASFGTSAGAEAAGKLTTSAGNMTALGPAPRKALSSLAGFVTRVATSGYRQKHLADDIGGVHADVQAVLEGLREAAGVIYLQQLENEERKTAARYREFLLEHRGPPEIILTLDSRWQSDRATFAARRKAARNYREALEVLARGNGELVAHARKLRASELPGLLSPYGAQLEALVPAIQGAFQAGGD